MRAELLIDLATEALDRAGHLTLRVTGTSMLPTVRPGSSVYIRRAEIEDVRIGDIVLVRCAAGFRLHRLVKVLPGALLVTRGDSVRQDDPPEPASRLLGRLAA